jgi:hypothetical protein
MPLAFAENEIFNGAVIRYTEGDDTLWFQIPEEFQKILKRGYYKATVEAGYLSVDINTTESFK